MTVTFWSVKFSELVSPKRSQAMTPPNVAKSRPDQQKTRMLVAEIASEQAKIGVPRPVKRDLSFQYDIAGAYQLNVTTPNSPVTLTW